MLDVILKHFEQPDEVRETPLPGSGPLREVAGGATVVYLSPGECPCAVESYTFI